MTRGETQAILDHLLWFRDQVMSLPVGCGWPSIIVDENPPLFDAFVCQYIRKDRQSPRTNGEAIVVLDECIDICKAILDHES